jgi:hypothetical protein
MPQSIVSLGKISDSLHVYHVLILAVADRVRLGIRTGPNHSIMNFALSHAGSILPVTLTSAQFLLRLSGTGILRNASL